MSDVSAVALVQLCAGPDADANLRAAERLVLAAADAGAACALLPEAFAYVGPAAGRLAIAEPLDAQAPGPLLERCLALAERARLPVVFGGFPETCDEARSYNTLFVVDPDGTISARYRKLHLFDVDLADGTRVGERASTGAGDELAVTDLPCGRTGLSICYDLRFAPLYQRLVDLGADVLLAPSAFTASTGRAHWHLLLRARAVECQAWMLAPAQYGDHGRGRRSFGHSLAVDPWGEIVLDLGDGPGFGIVQVDHRRTREVRAQLPSLAHRRALPEASGA